MKIELDFDTETYRHIVQQAKEDDLSYKQVVVQALRTQQLFKKGYLVWDNKKVMNKMMGENILD